MDGETGALNTGAQVDGQHEHAVRDRLLESAATLFARRGYEGTSVREICAAAGVTKPTLYYYFGSKMGLAKSLFEEASRDILGALRQVGEGGGSLPERLRAFARAVFRMSSESPDACRFFFITLFRPSEVPPSLDFDTLIPAIRRQTAALFRGGRSADELDDGDDVRAMILLGVLQAYAVRFVRREDLQLTPALADRVVAQLLAGLMNNATPCPGESSS